MAMRTMGKKFLPWNQSQDRTAVTEEVVTQEMYEKEARLYRPYRLTGTAAAVGAAVFSLAAVCSDRWLFAMGKKEGLYLMYLLQFIFIK